MATESKKSGKTQPSLGIAVPDDVQHKLSLVSQGKGRLFVLLTPRSVNDARDGAGTVVTFFIDLTKDRRSVEIRHTTVPWPFGEYCLFNPLRRAAGGHYLLIQHPRHPTAHIYIVDPFTSPTWSICGVLTDRAPYPQRAMLISKAVTREDSIVPGTIVVAIARPLRELLWTAIGQPPPRLGEPVLTKLGRPLEWFTLSRRFGDPNLLRWFYDIIWRPRDNLFWALSLERDIALAFDFSSACSGKKLVEAQVMTLDLPPGFNYLKCSSNGWELFANGLFVDAPSALFVVRWEKVTKKGEEVRRHLHVQKLMDTGGGAEKRWENVTSLDGYSFFLGTNHSVAWSAADFPGLRSNCIYLPLNGRYPTHDMQPDYDSDRLRIGDPPVNWIYNLDNASWEPCVGVEDAWMMPLSDCPE